MSTRIGDYVMCSDYDIIQLTRPRCVCRVIVFVLLSHTALLRALGTHRDAQLSRMPRALPLGGSTQHAGFEAITLAIAMLSSALAPSHSRRHTTSRGWRHTTS